nr:hypothetical protein [Methylocapsa palsarum]
MRANASLRSGAVASREPVARRRAGPSRRAAAVELEIDGVVVCVASGADEATIAAVIGALKARGWRLLSALCKQGDFVHRTVRLWKIDLTPHDEPHV